jgi:hypothetical protein
VDHEASRNDNVSMEEIEAEDAVSLPNKEVLSLLDVNANVDLGLDLAAPVDLAVAANLNVAAPIEASAAANVLSPDATALGVAEQGGHLDQSLSGSATATAPQHAVVGQDSSGGASPTEPATGSGASAATGGAIPGSGSTATDPGATAGGAAGTGDAVGGAVSNTTGGVDSLLNGGSLLDANINVDATANLAAPIDGAVAANANVAAPVDAAVAANIASPGATAEALAPQTLDVEQNLDNVSADATATQDANVSQQ